MTDLREQLVDEVLVMDCQRGHVKALETLISRWQKRLWRYVYRLTGSSEAAWEVTQDSWLGIVQSIGRLHDPAKFKAWAYRITTNKANDWKRNNLHRHTVPAAGSQEQTTDAAERSGHDAVQRLDASIDVHTILRRLPEPARAVLTLYYLEEFGVADLATVLRIPIGTVKSRLHTARGEFRALWRSMCQAGEPEEASQTKEH
jgi:RNA polymerase sigma-70 factor (ECF subfamily)